MTNIQKIFGALALMITASAAYAAIGTPHTVELGFLNEGNLMRPGNIIQTLDYSAPEKDATACRESCRGNPDCNAFTYAEPKDKTKGAICYHRMIALPNGARRDHPAYDRVFSGTRVSFFAEVTKQSLYANRVVLKGTPVSTFRVANDDTVACSDACYRDGNCDSWTYAPHGVADKQPGGICRTFAKSGTLGAQQGYISGIVRQKSFPPKGPSLTPRRPKAVTSPKADPASNGTILQPRPTEPIGRPSADLEQARVLPS